MPKTTKTTFCRVQFFNFFPLNSFYFSKNCLSNTISLTYFEWFSSLIHKNHTPTISIIQLCYRTAFYPYFYSFVLLQFSVPFHLNSVGHSWTYYILLQLCIKSSIKEILNLSNISIVCLEYSFLKYLVITSCFSFSKRSPNTTKPPLGSHSNFILCIIVSMSTRYDAKDSLVSLVISGLASQPSPILPDLMTPIFDFLVLLCNEVCSECVRICKFSNLLSCLSSFI